MPIAGGFDRSYYVEDLGRNFHPRVLYEDDRKLPAPRRKERRAVRTLLMVWDSDR